MTRKEFTRLFTLLGLGAPFLPACGAQLKEAPLKASDKVLIIGAGAAGLTAAYLLNQQGVEVQLLEADNRYGGRMKRTTTFANFPIPTGAEWLHVERKVFDEIVNDEAVSVDIVTKPYDFEVDYALVDGERKSLKDLGFGIDQKFINASWYDFYDQYIVPSIQDKISLNQAVQSIDYSGEQLLVVTGDTEYRADRVIVTVPLKLLQQKAIRFIPELPSEKLAAIDEVLVWDGCKAFIEFSERFYPTAATTSLEDETDGHKLFYDAAYGQDTEKHILGVFAVGPVSDAYRELDEPSRINHILAELDELFDGQASPNYVTHIFQDWSKEPYAQGAYVHYFPDWRDIRTLGNAVADKLYFAGDAYTDGNDWSSVHAAARSAIRVVEALVG